ncbi:serine/threonine-protein kinase PAK 2-like [Symsagittifera roscoffensis]|uniref:serine/threonine-protein kinase PAK 2-like n=1 Tax=Symsagittifera roscoffensis TaxID=84072 RepID=UPI00307BEA55
MTIISICNGQYKYDDSKMLGRGGFGTVYRGIGADIAIKMGNYANAERSLYSLQGMVYGQKAMTNDRLDRLAVEELKFLKALKHPNIVTFFDYDKVGNKLYLVMELCDGDLDKYLRPSMGKMNEAQLAGMIRQVSGGLCFLHDKGVIHRDIKGPNILTKGSQFKVADFGIALLGKNFDDEDVIGTPAYMAPEYFGHNVSSYNSKVDVWAFGVVICECAMGWKASPGSNPCQKQSWRPENLQNVSANLRDLLNKALEINRDRRCSMKEVNNHSFTRG